MKLFTLGLIAGTAFADPNLRPTDRKLNDDAEQTIDTDHTLTLSVGTYDKLNTIAGVKKFAVAFKTQEQTNLATCADNLAVYNIYYWATAKKAYKDYEDTNEQHELCHAWSAYNSCITNSGLSTEDAALAANAEYQLNQQPSRRRLPITVGLLDNVLTYLNSSTTTCTAKPTEDKPLECPASAPDTVDDPGDWMGGGDDPNWVEYTPPDPPPSEPTGCGPGCDNAPTDPAPTDPQNECSVRKLCIAEKVCGIKRVILALDPTHVFSDEDDLTDSSDDEELDSPA